MKRFFESIKRRPVLWSSVALGTVAATAVTAKDPNSSWLDLYTGTGEGIVLSGELPEGAIGVRAAFKYGGPGKHEWTKSDVVPPLPDTNKFAVKLAVGDGPVIFGVQTVAGIEMQDQPVCMEIPDITKEYFKDNFAAAPGNLPWAQPGNVFFNTVN